MVLAPPLEVNRHRPNTPPAPPVENVAPDKPAEEPDAVGSQEWMQAQSQRDDWKEFDFRGKALATITVPDESEKITLPNGTVLDTKEVFLDELTPRLENHRFYSANEFIVRFDYDRSGNILSLMSAQHGKLTGPLLVFSEPGALLTVASYLDGLLNGNLLIFNAKGKLVLFGRFRKAYRDGWFCLFDSTGELQLIRQYERDKLMWSFAVKKNAVVESVEKDGAPPLGGALAASRLDFDGVFHKFKENELKLKQALAAWDEDLRRQVAVNNALEKRYNIIDRGRADNTGLIQSLQQWSKGYNLEAARPNVIDYRPRRSLEDGEAAGARY